jgi:hypothetical protein
VARRAFALIHYLAGLGVASATFLPSPVFPKERKRTEKESKKNGKRT